MVTTPEGRVKKLVRKLIDDFQSEFEVQELTTGGCNSGAYLYAHWPVQNGMGQPTLDCVMCYFGQFIGIETKAEGKDPTPRQTSTIRKMEDSGAVVMVIRNAEDVEALRRALNMIRWSRATANCK